MIDSHESVESWLLSFVWFILSTTALRLCQLSRGAASIRVGGLASQVWRVWLSTAPVLG
jgi:hypothetical protein